MWLALGNITPRQPAPLWSIEPLACLSRVAPLRLRVYPLFAR